MRCEYFGTCGGCFYSLPYGKQIEEKERTLCSLFGREIRVGKSPVINGYRNRMDFVYAFGKFGLRKKGTYREAVDIERCGLMSERMNSLFSKVRASLARREIQDYDYLRHEGYLRYAVLREGKFTGETMVNFITSSKDNDILPVITDVMKHAKSVVWSVNEGLADVSFGEVYRTFGSPFITEKFGQIIYRISPNTFFQSNSYVTLEILKKIRGFVRGKVLDLYCGVGTISLYIADRCERITGVESSEESVKLAEENAKANGIKNTNFVCEETKKFLKTCEGDFDFVISDPPRSGMGKKVCKRLLSLGAEKLILMSCNPSTLKQDLEYLGNEYEVSQIKAFDMFPHTRHVEILCVLERA